MAIGIRARSSVCACRRMPNRPRHPRPKNRWPPAAANILPACGARQPQWIIRTVSVLAIVLITLLVTALVLAIGANLATTEKRLLYRPRRLYTSGDADFRRALGILLGPPLVAGNRITSLVNGEQIYTSMLNAIRTAQT